MLKRFRFRRRAAPRRRSLHRDSTDVSSPPTRRRVAPLRILPPSLLTYQGRPKDGPEDKFRLTPVGDRLAELLDCSVTKIDDCVGDVVKDAIAGMENGSVCLLENVRFYKEEEKNVRRLRQEARGARSTSYVNDAFGTAHRAHASTAGVTEFLSPSVAGFLLQKELDYLGGAVDEPKRPFCGHRRRLQGVLQDRRHRVPPGQVRQDRHRRRHGLHLPQGASASRRAPRSSRRTSSTSRRSSRQGGREGRQVHPPDRRRRRRQVRRRRQDHRCLGRRDPRGLDGPRQRPGVRPR